MTNYAPMLLTKAAQPFDSQDWSAEVKFDGWRALAYVSPSGTVLVSRKGNVLKSFPELGSFYGELKQTVVLDGEVVKFDESGMPSFEAMSNRKIAATFVAFDILHKRRPLVHLPLRERQRVLADIIPQRTENVIRSVPFVGQGSWLYEQMVARDGEGIVLKRLSSNYQQGIRSKDWVKVHTPHGRMLLAKRLNSSFGAN